MAKYVLVTGGELKNKGAQAMTFAIANEMASRCPDVEVILFSMQDYVRSNEEKAQYRFKILPQPSIRETFSLTTGLLKGHNLKRPNGKAFGQYKEIYKNAICQIDISGYALGSNWSKHIVINYLSRIALAKHFHIPVYLMPQSFGPFNFKGAYAGVINRMIKKNLKYARLIMAREEEGKKLLRDKYHLTNVIKTMDSVLQSADLDVKNIYTGTYQAYTLNIADHSVAIVPNAKNNKYGSEEELLSLYKNMIDLLLHNGKSVYFIYHAMEDLAICQKIKALYYKEENHVTVVDREINCIDFQNLAPSFDFIIASRYHSVVHSYKAKTPVFVLGWAIKYKDLTTAFEQSRFCYDVRTALEFDKIKVDLQYMIENFSKESEKIATHLSEIRKINVFDYLEKDLG